MAERDERAIQIESLYRQLYQLSVRQLEWVEKERENEQFDEVFGAMGAQWQQLQEQIAAAEKQASRKLSLTERQALLDQVEPIIIETRNNIEAAGQKLNQALHTTGTNLRSARGHKQALRAYSGSEQDEAIFFDEKK